MADNIQTGFRVAENMNRDIEAIAAECGMSKNAAMRMLMSIGIKVYQESPQLISAHFLSQNVQSPVL